LTGRVLLGAVIGPHGIKGEVRVKTFTLNPENLGLYGALATKSGRRLNVAALRATKAGEAIVAFEGVDDRNAAETLVGEELYIERAALPEPEAGEFYGADLIGLTVEDLSGKHLGKVLALHNFGAGDMIEIELLDGKTELIPVSADTVRAIDLASGRIVVQPPPETDET
jgi:16S rRNA processing protein RimM